jgi:malate synthase
MTISHIPYYLDYLSETMIAQQWEGAVSVKAVPGLRVSPGLRESFPKVETDAALAFVASLYEKTSPHLRQVLEQRGHDRAFIDRITAQCTQLNEGRDFHSAEYQTVIGRQDAAGRIVVGPVAEESTATGGEVEVPDFMAGDQVTLFGPPDTEKMSINAMNTLHRRLPNEPAIIAELVDASGQVPRWGADNEDSKTPITASLLSATQNLMGCFNRTLRYEDTERGKVYALAETGLSKPVKRIPGLALPDGSHLFRGTALPLHLVDFALHVFHNWAQPEGLVFYVPKLENEEEATYLKALITEAEAMLLDSHPEYALGSIKLFIVFESPRSIFRIRQMADVLYPHFLGGSLGWHDFLGSTARLFRHDPNYRIPVKADPNIVINHIRESHQILAESLDPIGGIKIGGMYGVLYEDGNPESFEVSMIGFIKDVFTQLKRTLDGFWVAHPSFVRVGIAMVEAWRRRKADSDDDSIKRLITALIPNTVESVPLIEFVLGPDVPGLTRDHPLYTRGVLAADLQCSDVIANDDPIEVRYNVFQAIQYLADWLCGNGCVALPAVMRNRAGEEVFVRVMDDLATTERSRWELWAEVRHGRVSKTLFESILREEIEFIQSDGQSPTKRVQVKWTGDAARWYPIAVHLLRKLVLDEEPVEFATELLMPFTLDVVRESADPWATVTAFAPDRYLIPD